MTLELRGSGDLINEKFVADLPSELRRAAESAWYRSHRIREAMELGNALCLANLR